ncbi:MAG: DUF1287 domain-containing protein [Chlorobi bacterium]|nr:DUF1287 domain-containing protein [Chlorobiota bacterium]MCI0716525.1 DUF1287 domain-containing protein [Chlorobiota bacterium]
MAKFTILVFIVISTAFFVSCSKGDLPAYSRQAPGTTQSKNENSKTDSVKGFNLTENQKKILEGAKKCLEAKFSYDMEMAYHVLKYRDGEFTGTKVFPNGDLDPTLGVCTDVTIRALRWGGVCDLQEEIYNDVKSNWSDYPMKRWGAKKPDQNIDHRRVPNQMVWFSKHWEEITSSKYEPGDVVAWDMNSDGWGDHIGIVSDKSRGDTPYLIHNFPDPGYVAEEDILNRWEIVGHYRVH